jgi:signal transduction histidine kinase
MIEEGSDILRTEATDLSELTAAACETVKARAEEAGATIKTLLPEGEVMVRCDRVYTRGVILNLLDNSLKYAGRNPDIEVEMLVHKSYCELKVRDNGPGIPNEYIARVFDKFFRVPGSDRHDVKGYGLGLSYAASVMKMQGGAVKAHNLPGGIEFVLTFPLYRG